MNKKIVYALRKTIYEASLGKFDLSSRERKVAFSNLVRAVSDFSDVEVSEGRQSIFDHGNFGQPNEKCKSYDYADLKKIGKGSSLHSQHLKLVHTKTLMHLWMTFGNKLFSAQDYHAAFKHIAATLNVHLENPTKTIRAAIVHDIKVSKHMVTNNAPKGQKAHTYLRYRLTGRAKNATLTKKVGQNTSFVFVKGKAAKRSKRVA